MVQKISPEKESAILDLYFSGNTWDDISSKTGAGKGTIGVIIKGLYSKYGKENITTAVEAIKSFKAKRLTTEKAFAGARIYSVTKKMQINDEEFFKFLSDVYKKCMQHHLTPQDLVQFAQVLFEVHSRTKMPIEKIPSYIKELEAKKLALEESIAQLEQERQDAAETRDAELKKQELTQDMLEDYSNSKKQLEMIGVKIDELEKLDNLLRQVRDMGYSPQKLVEYASREQDFEARIDGLQARLDELNLEIQSCEQRISSLIKDVQTYEAKLEALKAKNLDITDSISAVDTIRRKGIDPLRIVQWEAILNSCGTTTYGFEQSIKEYEKLENLLASLKEEIASLQNKKRSIKSEVDTLSEQKTIVESALIKTRDLTLKMMTEGQEKATGAISALESSVISSIEQVKQDSTKKIDEVTEDTKKRLRATVDVFDEMIAKVSFVSERFGKISSITPLYELIARVEGEPPTVLLSVITLIDRLLLWIEKNPDQSSIKTEIVLLRSAIVRQLGPAP